MIEDMPEIPSWRASIVYWPLSMRIKWGELANRLQDAGHVWYEAEWLAFKHCWASLLKFEKENPDKPIPWNRPRDEKSDNDFQYDSIVTVTQAELDSSVAHNRAAARTYDAQKAIINKRTYKPAKRQTPDELSPPKRKAGSRKKKHDPGVKNMF